jgi:hypothetical protein
MKIMPPTTYTKEPHVRMMTNIQPPDSSSLMVRWRWPGGGDIVAVVDAVKLLDGVCVVVGDGDAVRVFVVDGDGVRNGDVCGHASAEAQMSV